MAVSDKAEDRRETCRRDGSVICRACLKRYLRNVDISCKHGCDCFALQDKILLSGMFSCVLHCLGLGYLSTLIFNSALHILQGAMMSL